jgi:SAM-dependent methyltransferase
VLVPSGRIQQECRLRERFIQERLPRPASPDELKDLTDFFHGENADILICGECSLLVRNELEPPPARAYSQDEYNPAVMERLYPRYLDAFRRKEQPYRSMLPQRARVVEVGSHYGAFLQTAEEWGWEAEGVDVGKDTTRFAQSKGFTVHHCELSECKFAPDSLDGVFIWNCFEQIEDPKPLLRESRRILRQNGLLTVRTPNGLFYSMCQQLLSDGVTEAATQFLIEALGYNNLLGFPYLCGHSAATLQRLIEPFGFRLEHSLNSELITFPLPESSKSVEDEERRINAEVRLLSRSLLSNHAGVLTGSWIEVSFRAHGNTNA